MVVPPDQRAGSIYHQAPAALQRAGVHVVTSRPRNHAPDVMLIYPRALGQAASVGDVLKASEQGAGLVLVYSSDLATVPDELLRPWRARIEKAAAETARVELVDHPITRGISNIFIWRVPATIKGLRPLIKQGRNVIAAQGTRDGRRIVILPLDAVVPGQAGDIIPPPNMKLLVQAVVWAAGEKPSGEPAVSSEPSGTSGPADEEEPAEEQPPGERGSFRAIAYVDMAADNEDWPEIAAAVTEVLKSVGLRVENVRMPRASQDDKDKKKKDEELVAVDDPRRLPLIRALKDNPALVVVGSCRPFAEAEQVAVVSYVESGGALLALPRGTHKTNRRLVWLNELLVDFGLAATLARPKGNAVATARIVRREMENLGEIPDGIRVVGGHSTPWVTVNGVPVAIAERFGTGKVGLIDPLPLVKAKDEKTRDAWAKLMRIMLRYLLAGMELR